MDKYMVLKRMLSKPVMWYKKIHVSGNHNIILKPGILAPNHADWFDVVALGAGLRRKIHWVASKGLIDDDMTKRMMQYGHWLRHGYAERPDPPVEYNDLLTRAVATTVGGFLKNLDVIVAVEENGNTLGNFMEKVGAALEENELVCMFPGGDIYTDGHIATFKAGLAYALHRHYLKFSRHRQGLPVPIYPVAIKNTNSPKFSREPIYIKIGEDMFLPNYLVKGRSTRNSLIAFTKDLEANVKKLYAELP